MVSVSDELICTRRSQRSAKQGTHTDIQAVKEYCRQGCLLNDDWLELNTVQNYTSVQYIHFHTLPYNLVLFVWGLKGLDFTRLLTARRYLFSRTRFYPVQHRE